MEVCALSSGSSGNCFYIENNKKSVLIDAGISCKQIVERLNSINKIPEQVKAIFITHEHLDHIKGARVFSEKFNVPVFATEKTVQNSSLSFCNNINFINNNETLSMHGMQIEAFSKNHKAQDPVSFTVSNGLRVSVLTDIGSACNNIKSNIKDSDFLFIESNYDEAMLQSGKYPYFLKKWISSDNGHLSNYQSSLAVLEHAPTKLRAIVLSHLSENNNTAKHALNQFKLLKERSDLNPQMFVSTKFQPTDLFVI